MAIDLNLIKILAHETIIKGDGKYIEIAAASVLAKTYRDELMEKLSLEFPIYQLEKKQRLSNH
jgi:ribonuclease HII